MNQRSRAIFIKGLNYILEIKCHKFLYLIIITILILVIPHGISANDEIENIPYLLWLSEKAPPENEPREKMYSKNGIIYCTGDNEISQTNNKAAELMEQGDYNSAINLLKEGLKKVPLFFAFRYNIGTCYVYTDKLTQALMNFEKAQNLLPEYHKTYIQIGYIYERRHKTDTSLSYYKKALKKNKRAYDVYVLIGDIYLGRNQLEMADKYYKTALDIEPKSTNALLGKSKILFSRKKYFKAMTIIKYITPEKGYDKSLHYVYAECAYKLQDYKTAYEQYNTLLKFRNDKFFLTNSISLIKHKLDLCRRFIEIEQ